MENIYNNFINYAHRGASEYAPENTLLSFYLGLYMGANGIETDVQLTKDGVPVLFHDDTLERMTGEKGCVADYTFSELQSFNVKKNGLTDKIVSFEDFLAHFSHKNLTFAIELKGDGTAIKSVDLLRKYNMLSKTIITSFKFKELVDVKTYAPEFRTGYLALEDIDDTLLDKMKETGIEELCPESKVITAEKVKEWKEKGFEVRAWGIYNEQIMKDVYHTGVNGMTVNFPDKLTEYIRNLK
ncbi:MAG: hypothetical protein E7347_01830 [Clostridiales bacterium]|nr:hypothetical protein [Clostridiales bacterium]